MVCKNARFRNGIWRFLFSDLLIFPSHNLRNTVDIRGDIGKGRKIAANDLVRFGKAHKIKQGVFYTVYAVAGKISCFIGNDPAREYPAQICLFGQIIRCKVKHRGRVYGQLLLHGINKCLRAALADRGLIIRPADMDTDIMTLKAGGYGIYAARNLSCRLKRTVVVAGEKMFLCGNIQIFGKGCHVSVG